MSNWISSFRKRDQFSICKPWDSHFISVALRKFNSSKENSSGRLSLLENSGLPDFAEQGSQAGRNNRWLVGRRLNSRSLIGDRRLVLRLESALSWDSKSSMPPCLPLSFTVLCCLTQLGLLDSELKWTEKCVRAHFTGAWPGAQWSVTDWKYLTIDDRYELVISFCNFWLWIQSRLSEQ